MLKFTFRVFCFGISAVVFLSGVYMFIIPMIHGEFIKETITLGLFQIALGIMLFTVGCITKKGVKSKDLLMYFSKWTLRSTSNYLIFLSLYIAVLLTTLITQLYAWMPYESDTWKQLDNRMTASEISIAKTVPKCWKSNIWNLCVIYQEAGLTMYEDSGELTDEEVSKLSDAASNHPFESKSNLMFKFVICAYLCGCLSMSISMRRKYLTLRKLESHETGGE